MLTKSSCDEDENLDFSKFVFSELNVCQLNCTYS